MTDHVNPNDAPKNRLDIFVIDEPGVGPSCHEYRIVGKSGGVEPYCIINFQNGAVSKVGANGVTDEALLVILADRLSGLAQNHVKAALNHLSKLQENYESATHSTHSEG